MPIRSNEQSSSLPDFFGSFCRRLQLTPFAGEESQRRRAASRSIRRTLEELRAAGEQNARGSLDSGNWRRPLPYVVRPQTIRCQVRPGFSAFDVPPATRFNVTHADPSLLAFLGKKQAGFHLFELSGGALARVWRDDLTKLLETRNPVAGCMTLFLDSGEAGFDHVALPVLEAGQVVAIRGWFRAFSPAAAVTWPIELAQVGEVRRFERTQSFKLPAYLLRPEARWPGIEGAPGTGCDRGAIRGRKSQPSP